MRAAAPQQCQHVHVGINFGSGTLRAAITTTDDPQPRKVPMRKAYSALGRLEETYMFPTDVIFGPARGQFQLLGLCDPKDQKTVDCENTSSGVKQSLDVNLCQDGEGRRFTELCATYAVRNRDVFRKFVTFLWDTLVSFLHHSYGVDGWKIKRVEPLVPAIWTRDSHGEKIQNDITKLMVEAGFPEDPIHFESEPGATVRGLLHGNEDVEETLGKEGRKGSPRVLLFDIGSGTADFVGAEIQGGRVILLSEPRGCGGGMGSGWTKLKRLCKDKANNKEEANDLFNAAQLHFFKMSEDCTPYKIGDRTIISADEFRRITIDAYQEPLRLAREMLLDITNIDYVILSGGACASNFFIKEKWTACIEDWRRELERQGRESDAGFGVIIADAEDADHAGAKGASLQYDENPMEEFEKSCFGIIVEGYYYGPGAPSRTVERIKPRRRLLAFKNPGSSQFETKYERMKINTQPSAFRIEPHYVVESTQLEEHSLDTENHAWDVDRAIPMNEVPLNLSGKVRTGDTVKIRFRWGDLGKTLIFEMTWRERQTGRHRRHKEALGLLKDKDRLFLKVKGASSEGVGDVADTNQETAVDDAGSAEAGREEDEHASAIGDDRMVTKYKDHQVTDQASRGSNSLLHGASPGTEGTERVVNGDQDARVGTDSEESEHSLADSHQVNTSDAGPEADKDVEVLAGSVPVGQDEVSRTPSDEQSTTLVPGRSAEKHSEEYPSVEADQIVENIGQNVAGSNLPARNADEQHVNLEPGRSNRAQGRAAGGASGGERHAGQGEPAVLGASDDNSRASDERPGRPKKTRGKRKRLRSRPGIESTPPKHKRAKGKAVTPEASRTSPKT